MRGEPSIESQLVRHAWRATPASFAERLSRGRWWRKPHLELISNAIADAAYAGDHRIILSAPPRHGKSEIVSRWGPAWYLDTFPDRRVISCSYAARIARRWGRQVRNIVRENSEILRAQLTSDNKAADSWETTAGGGMTTAGVGGPITSLGADLMLIDDPVKNWKEAYSETHREAVWDWWTSTASTRLEPGASAVVIMTRWHHDDLAGRLLRQHEEDPDAERWTEIVLPAIAGPGDALGREIGEALWPERYSAEALRRREVAVGPLVWSALYQQQPYTGGAGFFPADQWRYYDVAPERFDRVIASWDLAFKETSDSDYVVGGVWGSIGEDDYLLDLWRERADIIKTMDAIRAQVKRWRPSGVYIEDKANGPAVMTLLRNEIGGIVPVEPDGSKQARAVAVSPRQQSGHVWLPSRASWVRAYVAEHESFPSGPNDDQVDMTTQALKVLRLSHNVSPVVSFSLAGLTRPSLIRGA